jgi:hypothetical protein
MGVALFSIYLAHFSTNFREGQSSFHESIALEWIILSIVIITGILFWFLAALHRAAIPDTERAQFILEDYA